MLLAGGRGPHDALQRVSATPWNRIDPDHSTSSSRVTTSLQPRTQRRIWKQALRVAGRAVCDVQDARWYDLGDLAEDLQLITGARRLRPRDLDTRAYNAPGNGRATLDKQPHGDRGRVPAAGDEAAEPITW